MYINDIPFFTNDKLEQNKKYLKGKGCEVYGNILEVKETSSLLEDYSLNDILYASFGKVHTFKTSYELLLELRKELNK